MKRLTWIMILLVLATAACKKPQGFEYRDVKNISIDRWGFDQSTVNLELVYYNPNNFGVHLRNVHCDVYLNNNYVGKFSLDTLMHIQRHAEFSLPARMQVDMRNVLKNSLSLLFNNEVQVRTKGTTRVGKGCIFVTVPFSYEGRHSLNLF